MTGQEGHFNIYSPVTPNSNTFKTMYYETFFDHWFPLVPSRCSYIYCTFGPMISSISLQVLVNIDVSYTVSNI